MSTNLKSESVSETGHTPDRKYSRLMAAAVRQTGIPEHQIESCIIEVLKDELSNGREHR
jgi:hypothetical protein